MSRKPGRGRIYSSITETIGDTPIVRLDKLAKEKGVKANLLAKLEFFNPIAPASRTASASPSIDSRRSVKAKLPPGRTTLVEADLRQYRHRARFCRRRHAATSVILTMPETMSIERRALLSAATAPNSCSPTGRGGMKGAVAQGRAASLPRRPAPSSRQAVREPGKPGNPPRDDGRGNLERHRRRRRHLRCRASAPAARSPASARC